MASANGTSTADALTFGRFRLIPTQQLLLGDGVPVRIGSRALEILTVLARRSGELVDKHELLAAVWPDTFVDESNLKVHICTLRRSLDDVQKRPQYIATVTGRGYRFVAPVQIESAGRPLPRSSAGQAREIADILAAFRGKPHVTVLAHAAGRAPSLVQPLT